MTTIDTPFTLPRIPCTANARRARCLRGGRRPPARPALQAPAPVPAPPPLQVRFDEREVLLEGRAVEMTRREFDVLAYLVRRPRQVVTRDELLTEVWGSSRDWQDPATVTEHVRRIRRKIQAAGDGPQWVTTVRGVGYRFEPV